MHDEQIKLKVGSPDSRAQEPRWPSWAPVPNKPTGSVDVKRHSTNPDSRFATESQFRLSFHMHESSVAMEIASGFSLFLDQERPVFYNS